jgi:hypothetical protein
VIAQRGEAATKVVAAVYDGPLCTPGKRPADLVPDEQNPAVIEAVNEFKTPSENTETQRHRGTKEGRK